MCSVIIPGQAQYFHTSDLSYYDINSRSVVMKIISVIIALAASLSLLTFCTQKEVRIEQVNQ